MLAAASICQGHNTRRTASTVFDCHSHRIGELARFGNFLQKIFAAPNCKASEAGYIRAAALMRPFVYFRVVAKVEARYKVGCAPRFVRPEPAVPTAVKTLLIK